MSDRRYQLGPPREQGQLLPSCVEDYVSSSNPVRAIDAYVDSLDLERLGFTNTQGGLSRGRPADCPSDLLKLYLYGYLNRVRSSRRLEQETYRNLEVIWLLKGVHPCYKTIADFRKQNLSGIKSVNRDFVLLCRELGLFGGELVGIDGSFFKGSASRESIYTAKKLRKQLEKLDADIAHYLAEMKRCDQAEPSVEREDAALGDKLARLRARREQSQARLLRLKASGQAQLSTTDEDARLLSKRGQSTVGYNVQYAVDEKHKLLAVCDVSNEGNDTRQLLPMSEKSKAALETEDLEVAADSGYYNQAHIKGCGDLGITPYVPVPDRGAGVRKAGRYEREDFQYDKERDAYRCPAGHELKRKGRQRKGDVVNHKYASQASVCRACPLKDDCLPPKTPYRQLYRYEHEEAVDAHKERMGEKGREYMKKRSGLAEHPFGTFKLWMGWTHFLLRGLEKVGAEMNLMMLSYNFKRVLNILGLEAFRAYCLRRRLKNSGLFYLLAWWIVILVNLLNRMPPISPLIQERRRGALLSGLG